MVDVKNLNRVKGILSAKHGAEIPKFQQGAKFAMYNGSQVIYSSDRSSWFNDESLTSAYTGSLGGFKSIQYDPKTTKNPIIPPPHLQTEIPGDPKITPTTSVENAADIQEKVRLNQQEYEAGKRYETIQISQEDKAQAKTTLNKPPVLDTNLLQQDINKGISETSAGFNLANVEKAQSQIKWTNVGNAIGQGSEALINGVGQAFAAKQQAADSDLTKTADTAYSGIAETAKSMGPIGQAVGSIMGIAKGAGDIIQELGGGTDQQTKTDKWMDSAFFSWNIGMLNGFAGKNTQDFGVDQNIMAQVGSSYGGTVDAALDASEKAGKKYGLFSTKARKKADAAINKARTKQNLMGDIADVASDQRLTVQSMGEQAGIAYSLMTDGGYNQKYTYAAKHGGSLEWNPVIEIEWEPQIELNWELPTFKEGGNIDINKELEWIPELQSGGPTYPHEYLDFIADVAKYAPNLGNPNPNKYNLFRFWELNNKPKTFKQAVELGMFALQDDGFYHGNSVGFNQDTGEYEWIKEPGHETRWMEKAFYDGYDFEVDENGEPVFSEDQPLYEGVRPILKKKTGEALKESEYFRAKYDLIEDENGNRKYVPKKFKEGGSVKNSDIPKTEETTQKNVIPEGALHKNKHHMEHAEGLTKKGIPVIDDDGDQQAEIEHSEIIFTLEVTKKLEEYYEIFYSDESSNKEKEQAALDTGKLLVFQILENTEDRTGLIESCKKGGSLTLKKSTDDLIEEVLEWMPTVVIIEEEVKEKPKKKEEKLDKELMKEAIKEVLIDLLTK